MRLCVWGGGALTSRSHGTPAPLGAGWSCAADRTGSPRTGLSCMTGRRSRSSPSALEHLPTPHHHSLLHFPVIKLTEETRLVGDINLDTPQDAEEMPRKSPQQRRRLHIATLHSTIKQGSMDIEGHKGTITKSVWPQKRKLPFQATYNTKRMGGK